MDQRKLIQHGISSLTMALPIKWLKQRDLKKGDALFVEEEGDKLVITTEKSIKLGKISRDITGLDRTSILLYIQSLYRFGYDEIEITFKNPLTIYHRTKEKVSVSSVIHKIVGRLIGAEIVDQLENRILIKTVVRETEEDFKVILRRAFLLMNEAADTLLQGIKKQDFNAVSTIEDMHDNINKFVNFCLRLLNKYGYPDVKKTCVYYHIIASIDKIVDILKYNARDYIKYRKMFSNDTICLMEKINQSIKMYYELFYVFNSEIVNKLSENRDSVKLMINKKVRKIPNEELIFLTNMKQILEIILDLTESRMGLEY